MYYRSWRTKIYVNKFWAIQIKPKKPKKPVNEVFNEFYVAKTIGAREYNRHKYMNAAKHYKKALFLEKENLEVLLRISNCYRLVGKMDLAWEYHAKAKKLHPESFKMLVNENTILYAMEDYVGCLNTCYQGRILFDNHKVFLVGTEKALTKIQYTPISDEAFDRAQVDQGKYRDGSARHKVDGMNEKRIALDEKNRLCPTSEKYAARQRMMQRMSKDRNDIQVNKYYHIISKSLEYNDFTSARKNTEMLTDFMERTNYKSMLTVLDEIYKLFGAHQLLVFQDVEEWDEQENHDRAMFFLGQHFVDDRYELEKSLYGLDIVEGKITVDSLTNRLNRSKCKTEHLYLYLQLAKLYLREGGLYNLLKTVEYSLECMQIACKIQNLWWYTNALLVNSSAGYQLDKNRTHLDKLLLVKDIGKMLNIPQLSTFAVKLRKITVDIEFAKIRPPTCRPYKFLYMVNDPRTQDRLGFPVAHVAMYPELGENTTQKFRRLVECLKKKYSSDSTMEF